MAADSNLVVIQHRAISGLNMLSTHMHSHYELYYLLAGRRNYFIAGESFLVEKGDVVLIEPGRLHKTYNPSPSSGSHQRILLEISPEMMRLANECCPGLELHTIFSPYKIISLDEEAQSLVERYLFRINSETEAGGWGSCEAIKLAVCSLLLTIKRFYNTASRQTGVQAGISSPVIKSVAEYIRQNCNENLSLQELSEKFYLSKFYLCKLFKKTTGYTISEFQTLVRIERAQQLIKLGGHKITDIAAQSGFQSFSHFSRTFKKLTGLTPMQFRKSLL